MSTGIRYYDPYQEDGAPDPHRARRCAECGDRLPSGSGARYDGHEAFCPECWTERQATRREVSE